MPLNAPSSLTPTPQPPQRPPHPIIIVIQDTYYGLRGPGSSMVVRIRLQRFGRHDRPFYRIVAADSRSPRDGRFIELVSPVGPVCKRQRRERWRAEPLSRLAHMCVCD